MMTLLMTTDTVGGVWNYGIELIRALEPCGIRVHLATMGPEPSGDQRRQAASLLNLSLHVSTYRLEWMPDPWQDVARAGDWLLGLEREVRPDLVHLNGYVHAALPWEAPVLVVAHSCVLSWWEAVKRAPLPDEWLRYASAVSAGLKAAEMLIAPSKAMLDALGRHYRGLPWSRVIHNGRDHRAFNKVATKDPFIFSAGRLWDEAKNLSMLDAAADRLKWPVRVAGDVESGDAAAAMRPHAVKLLGRLDEPSLARQLSRASIYALPARYEPFGLAVLEAALSECALVLGDIASLRELWGDTAVYVPADEPEALVNAINELIEDDARRSDLARAARSLGHCYSPRRMADAYLQAYHDLCGFKAVASRLHPLKG